METQMQVCNDIKEEFSWCSIKINGVHILPALSLRRELLAATTGHKNSASFAVRDCMQTIYNLLSAHTFSKKFDELSILHLMDGVGPRDSVEENLKFLLDQGITTKDVYDHIPSTTGDVKNTEGHARYCIMDYRSFIKMDNPERLANHIHEMIGDLRHGPLIGVFNLPERIEDYSGGVILDYPTITSLGFTLQTRAVMIIGYGITSNSIPYWKCQTGMGSGWATQGVLRISMLKMREVWSMTLRGTMMPMADLKKKSDRIVSLLKPHEKVVCSNERVE